MSDDVVKENHYLYRHYDADNNLLYVGISYNAIYRLWQHKRVSLWFSDIAKVTIEKFSTRRDALNAETKAIQFENPKHNIQKRKKKDFKENVYFGNNLHEKTAVETLNHVVSVNPLYTIQSAAMALDLRISVIKRLIESGRLGHVELLGNNINAKPKIYITGWQLISFLENEEREASNVKK